MVPPGISGSSTCMSNLRGGYRDRVPARFLDATHHLVGWLWYPATTEFDLSQRKASELQSLLRIVKEACDVELDSLLDRLGGSE